MSFGLNRAEVIGRLGADVTVNHLVSGGRVANLSIATDESYIDKTGERVDRTEWHRIVTFQPGLVDMLVKNARKGRLVYLAGTQALARYRADLWRRIRAGEIGIEELARLDGCWLACWCDEHCHGEVLARAAAWAASVLVQREAE